MRVVVAIIDRANLGRLDPLLRCLHAAPAIDLQIVCGGSTVVPEFGECAAELEQQYPSRVNRVYHQVAGGNSLAMACSVDVPAYARELHRLKPDCAILIGDRHEGLAFAIAASELRIPLVHIQGGERSGGIDDKRRYAITEFADYHVPATRRGLECLLDRDCPADSILAVGCPATDTMREIAESEPHVASGKMLVMFHPDTRHPEQGAQEFLELMTAVGSCRLLAEPVIFNPNCDAGGDAIRAEIKRQCGQYPHITNRSPRDFYRLLWQARLCVGNSSSFVRDAGFFGTPVVLVGDRQEGRECGHNAIRVPAKSEGIAGAIRAQIENGRVLPSYLYGDGRVCQRIVDALLAKFLPKRVPPLSGMVVNQSEVAAWST